MTAPRSDLATLSAKQAGVAILYASGLSHKRIAARLGCSLRNVGQHVQTIAEQWRLDPALDTRVQIAARVTASLGGSLPAAPPLRLVRNDQHPRRDAQRVRQLLEDGEVNRARSAIL